MGQRSESPQRRVIAVIGMHRSGTSLAVRALRALGAGLGDNLSTQPSPDNAKGHWEDQDVLRINRELLDTLALRWDLIGADDGTLMTADSLYPLVERARALVRDKVAESTVWAFKDPRTARLWPFWRRVLLEDDEFRPGFVWMIRRPWAVAQSLARRDGFGSLQSHLLWLNHNLAPFADVAASPHVVVDYDRLLDRPRQELERMTGALALQPASGQVEEEFIGGFLDPDLRHFDSAGEAPPGVGTESTANRAWRALLEVAVDASSLNAPEFLAEWREIGHETAAFSNIAQRVDSTALVEQAASCLLETHRQQLRWQSRRRTVRRGWRDCRRNSRRRFRNSRRMLAGVCLRRNGNRQRAVRRGWRDCRRNSRRRFRNSRRMLAGVCLRRNGNRQRAVRRGWRDCRRNSRRRFRNSRRTQDGKSRRCNPECNGPKRT